MNDSPTSADAVRAAPATRGPAPLALVLALVLAPIVAAAQEPPPVEVTVEGTFGPDALVEGGWGAVTVTLANRTSQSFSGVLEVGVSDWSTPPETHRVEVDVPAGDTRRVPVTVFLATSGASVDARYWDEGGGLLGLGSTSVNYAAGAHSVVVISDQPAHLRAALLTLQIEEPDVGYPSYPSAAGGTRTVNVPVGGCTLDGRTGDPILPADPHAYATVRTIIASLPTVSRLREADLRAIDDYVLAGGTLVLSPRTPADWALPIVREHFGEVSVREGFSVSPTLAPAGTAAITCASADLVDGIGCARVRGQGVIRLVPMDLGSPVGGGSALWPVSLVQSILREAATRDRPSLPLGLGLDPTDVGFMATSGTFSWLRRALDPNEGYRTSLALVAILLFLYVVVVGPVHFKLIERRNQPTLALVTTPILALGCALTLFGVGYLGKGILMRYRRLSFVELRAGAERGTSRSYTGFFFTRPASATLTSPEASLVRRIAAPSGVAGPAYLHREGRVDADGMRGGLWDTVFMREDRMIDVPGGIRFEMNGARYAAVINDSDLDLRSAFFVDTVGSAYVVGDVPAHGRAPIAETTGWYVVNDGPRSWWGEGGDSTTTTLSALLRLSDEEAPLARGLQAVLADRLIDDHAGALYAWIDADPDPRTDPGFARDWDRRLIRVDTPTPLVALATPVVDELGLSSGTTAGGAQ